MQRWCKQLQTHYSWRISATEWLSSHFQDRWHQGPEPLYYSFNFLSSSIWVSCSEWPANRHFSPWASVLTWTCQCMRVLPTKNHSRSTSLLHEPLLGITSESSLSWISCGLCSAFAPALFGPFPLFAIYRGSIWLWNWSHENPPDMLAFSAKNSPVMTFHLEFSPAFIFLLRNSGIRKIYSPGVPKFHWTIKWSLQFKTVTICSGCPDGSSG